MKISLLIICSNQHKKGDGLTQHFYHTYTDEAIYHPEFGKVSIPHFYGIVKDIIIHEGGCGINETIATALY